MPDLNIPDPNPRDLDSTQPGKPIKIPAPTPVERQALPPRAGKKPPIQTPPPPRSDDTPPRGIPPVKRKNDDPRPRSRRNDGLYLPAWSLAIMLLFVIGISFTILLLVYAVGGQFEPSGEPVVIIVTAIPSPTPPIPQFEPTLPDATLPGINAVVEQMPLAGPTLAPIVLTPTPIVITIGTRIRTTGEAVRVRPAPNLDNVELFFAEPDEIYMVVEGPQSGSGLTWWRVQDVNAPTRGGWIASNLIVAVSP